MIIWSLLGRFANISIDKHLFSCLKSSNEGFSEGISEEFTGNRERMVLIDPEAERFALTGANLQIQGTIVLSHFPDNNFFPLFLQKKRVTGAF